MPAPSVQFSFSALLRHGLITATFCGLIATGLALSTGKAWDTQLAYSLGIGMTTWLLIDLGRMLTPRPSGHYWVDGPPGIALVIVSIFIGFLVGSTLGDLYCGCSTWSWSGTDPKRLRSSIVITMAAATAAVYFFHSRGKQKAQQTKIAVAERDAAQARLKLLQTQLEPHMLFNTLANLRVLIGADPAQATQMLDRLIDYLRATLVASRATTHPLSAEFDRLRDYLELMAVRLGSRLRYTLELPADLAAWPVPTLLLQPLVENSIRHGVEPKLGGASLRVEARRVQDGLELRVLDTGIGIGIGTDDPTRQAYARQHGEPGTGFGLAQVRERLEAAFGAAARMEIGPSAEGEGTCCVIVLPALRP